MTNPTPHGQVPEALKHAEGLEWFAERAAGFGLDPLPLKNTAAAIRRLHAENEALRAAHVQNPAEIEHVAGDVSKNGAESNTMAVAHQGAAYAELPEQDVRRLAIENGMIRKADELRPTTWGRILRFAQAIHALRTQQPAPAGATPECLTCNDHGAVGNILTAEPCPDCTPTAPAGSAGALDEVFSNARAALLHCPDRESVRAILGTLRARVDGCIQKTAPAGVALPEGWVPLVITHEGQYPEEIAYGPQRMMDRLDKWLRKYFNSVVADKVGSAAAAPDLQPLHNLLYLAQRQTSKEAMQRVVGEARLELAKLRDAPTPQPAPATQQAVEVHESIEQLAAARYEVVPSHESMFHRWAVVAGDGSQQLYLGREVECENMARKFAGAFLDGAFVALQTAAPQTSPTPQADSQPAPVVEMRQFLALLAIRNRKDNGLFPQANAEVKLDDSAFERIGKLIDYYYPRDEADRAARAPADSVTAPAGVTVAVGSQEFDLADTGARFTTADMATACGQAFREGRATPPAQAADSVLEDAARYRALRDEANQLHEDDISVSDSSFTVYFGSDLDDAVDALIERAARKQGGA